MKLTEDLKNKIEDVIEDKIDLKIGDKLPKTIYDLLYKLVEAHEEVIHDFDEYKEEVKNRENDYPEEGADDFERFFGFRC